MLFNKDKTTLIKYPSGNTREKYTVPSGVKSIGEGTFKECAGLTDVIIPSGVTSIGSYAFTDCTCLANVTIPESVISIEGSAFDNCVSLTGIIIPNGVTRIRSNAFQDCTGLVSVTIPASVTEIGWHAFSGCDELVIYGYSGTAAETFAKNYKIEFIPVTDLVDSESNVTVTGDVPVEAQLKVSIIPATDTRTAYDITLTDIGGEYKPESTVTVKIPLPAGMTGAECRVYSENGLYSYTDVNAVCQGGFLVFSTGHIGKFVLSNNNLENIGDLNGDGNVTLSDVLFERKAVAGVEALSEDEISRGDIDGDGAVTLKDVLIMRKMVAAVG